LTHRHHASPDFWECYRAQPVGVRGLADKAFELLKANPQHPSLHFKKVGRFWSARVGLQHRSLDCGKEYVAEATTAHLLRTAEEAALAGVEVDVREYIGP
jgi:hypothetical protein